uniref:Replication protein A3 n=1 Tax=Nothobranchius furzeri TaxID=105023 RepID=A0A8C6LBS5_NOTFU
MRAWFINQPRINCSMLSQHINRPVCFVGRVGQVHPNGKTFTVSDGEGNTLSGIVEVLGVVSNKGCIMATMHNLLQENKAIPFALGGAIDLKDETNLKMTK